MISTEPVTVVVRTGRAGRYADWRIAPRRPAGRGTGRPSAAGSTPRCSSPPTRSGPPVRDRRERVAKAICAACPVREPCAVYALAHRELHGVWGGLSEADRRRRLAHP